jgi:hypothetical protein
VWQTPAFASQGTDLTQPLKKLAALIIATCFAASTGAQATSAAPPQNEECGRAQVLRLIDLRLDGAQAYNHVPTLSAAVVQSDKTIQFSNPRNRLGPLTPVGH